MMHRLYWPAFIASLSLALSLGPSESFGGAGASAGGKSAPAHALSHSSAIRVKVHQNFSLLRDHRQRNAGWGLWLTAGSFYGINEGMQPSNVEPAAEAPQPISQHITYTYDTPWDAVHRYPPPIRYASGCRTQSVIVPRGYGKKQSVNIVRCY
jgi:hypothetical protein